MVLFISALLRTTTGVQHLHYPMTFPIDAMTLSLFGVATAAVLVFAYRRRKKPQPVVRPDLVTDALRDGGEVYYFGVGSNLSRTKLENRSICGSKIHVLGMEPAVVPGHRLSFNLCAFPPLEPGMGSLEPVNDPDASEAVVRPYDKPECHGALIRLSASDYEKVYKSEGGGGGPNQPYEEIVVTCVPYDESRPSVRAVSLRARESRRWRRDPCPSLRYMTILREGAKELGLRPCYQLWLADHPAQTTSWALKVLAIHNMILNMTLWTSVGTRLVSNVQNWLLIKFYVLPTASRAKRIAGEVAAGFVLLPGALVGLCMRPVLEMTGKMHPRLKMLLKSFDR